MCGDPEGCEVAYCTEHTNKFGGLCEICNGVEEIAIGTKGRPLPAPPLCKKHRKVCRRQFCEPLEGERVQCSFRCCSRHIKNHNCQCWEELNCIRQMWPHGSKGRYEGLGTAEIDGGGRSKTKYFALVNRVPNNDRNLQGHINDDGEVNRDVMSNYDRQMMGMGDY